MADVFISYSRKDGDFVRRLTNALSRTGRDVWVDWEDIPRGENWLTEIFSGIENTDAFLLIVSRHSLMSEICNDEIRYAREKNKRIFPLIREEVKGDIFNEVVGVWYGKSWEQKARENWTEIGHLNWVSFNDDNRFDPEFEVLTATLETDQAHARAHTRYLVRALEWDRSRRKPSLLLVSDEITTAEIWLKDTEGKDPPPTPLHQEFITDSRRAEDERQRQAQAQARRIQQFRAATAVLALMATFAVIATLIAGTMTMNALSTQATVEFQATIFALEQNRVQIMLPRFGIVPTYDGGTPLPATVIAMATERTNLTQLVPTIGEFEGVEMVEVPVGCFLMGSVIVNAGPIHRQCFEEPFWIDRYEVTRAQYTNCVQIGACQSIATNQWSSRDDQPINNITWYQARGYCEWRRARLPTEAEWEYAARGPESWIYPWGDTFEENRLVFARNHRTETANVGGRDAGASWVGARDMSGNVWEWVSTSFGEWVNGDTIREFPYPYTSSDGREDLERTDVIHVRRGGGFDNFKTGLGVAERDPRDPMLSLANSGVRCARSV
jgi:formylglycine-generating enzyme required for sulfatase activity